MTVLPDQKVKEEILVFLRNSDILSTATRGVTTKTDSFTATASQTVFTLTSTNVRNIRAVTVQAVSKSAYLDYVPTYNTGSASVVTLNTGATLNDTVTIQYDYSTGTLDKIWPDYPAIRRFATDMPRIGFDMFKRPRVIGIGTTNYITDALVPIKIYDKGTYRAIDGYLTTLRQAFKTNQKGFYYFQLAVLGNESPIIPTETDKGVIFEKTLDVTFRFAFES